MAQQTAVEWFLHQLYDKMEMKGDRKVLDEIIIEAFSMEKEQIINAFNIGTTDQDRIGDEYYNDIYSHPDPSDDEIFKNFNHEGGIKYENNTQN